MAGGRGFTGAPAGHGQRCFLIGQAGGEGGPAWQPHGGEWGSGEEKMRRGFKKQNTQGTCVDTTLVVGASWLQGELCHLWCVSS